MELGKFLVYIDSYEESFELQRLFFQIGYEWFGSGEYLVKVRGNISNYYGDGRITDKKLAYGLNSIHDDVIVYDYDGLKKRLNTIIRYNKLNKLKKNG